jgi:nitrite reductase/ring-hydroxylating ferredoxin subunit
VLSALPAIASGAVDWADAYGAERRVGAVHAALNTAALTCFAFSWNARRRGRHAKGILLGLAGSAVATGGGYLGGHLTQRLGLGIDNTAFEAPPDHWVPTEAASEWTDGEPRRVDVDGTPVAVVRDRGQWHALDARCTHRGGPLDEGTVRDGCIECPWHQSRFRLSDGAVARGPAAAPEPVLGVRVEDDVVTVGPPD